MSLCEIARELDRLYLAADAATWRWIGCAEEDWLRLFRAQRRAWRRYERAVELARESPSALPRG